MGLFNKIIATVDVISKTAELAKELFMNDMVENADSDILAESESGIDNVRFFLTKDMKVRMCNLTQEEIVCQFCQSDPTGSSNSDFVYVEANGGNSDVTSYFANYMENGTCSITSIDTKKQENYLKTLISTLTTKTLTLGTSIALGALGIRFIPREKDLLVQVPEKFVLEKLYLEGSFLLKDKRITFSADIKPKNSQELIIPYNEKDTIDSIILYADFDVYSENPDEFISYLREKND